MNNSPATESDNTLSAELEAELRAVAPVLPPVLRSRTLMRCAAEREALRRARRRGGWRWAWTLAGLGAFHWGTSALLDAQNAALMGGNTGQHPPSLLANVPSSSDSLRLALQTRSHLLAALDDESGGTLKSRRDAS